MGWDEKKELPESDSSLGASLVEISENTYKLTTSQNLASGELSYTTAIGAKFKIKQVLVHASTGLASKTITLTYDSATGANYDTILSALDFDGNQDLAFKTGQEIPVMDFMVGDELKIASSSATVVGIVYVTIIYELVQ